MNTSSSPARILFPVLMAALFLSSIGAAPMPSKQASPVSALGGCGVFPSDNYWNTPVDTLPVHPASSAWINSIGATRGFHMDFGSGTWDGGPIGIPYNIVSGSSVTKYNVDFYYPDESDPGPYPIPANPKREWGSDHHILVVDSDDCNLYEIYDASQSGGQWYGGSGAIWSLNANALRPDTWTSADAAGFPILPGLARYDEANAGVINHALRFTTNCTADYYLWPARHVAQSGSCANPVPFGARFRLRASYDISGYSPQARVILQAMKTYGIVLADNGSPWYVSGAPSAGWDNDALHELDALTGNAFEAVNTAALIVNKNSAQARSAPNTPMQKVFASAGANDGWILESTEFSGAGGTLNAGNALMRLGDDAQDRQYRGVLHFYTSSLPDNAVIFSIMLRVKSQGVIGGNPFNTHGNLLADIRQAPFSASSLLQLADFQASANRNAAGTFIKTPADGWYRAFLKDSANRFVNVGGITQIRLRFSKDDNDDRGADFLNIYSGNAGAANRPQLIVKYYVP